MHKASASPTQSMAWKVLNLIRYLTHPPRMWVRAARNHLAVAMHHADVPDGARRESGDSLHMDCLMCRQPAAGHRIIGHVRPTHRGVFSVNDYRLVSCGSCETVYLLPHPTEADLRLMYQESTQFTGDLYTQPAGVEQVLGNLRNRLWRLDLFPGAGESCLEVGAGPAWVARVCKERDAGIITVAQDVTGECAGRCPWVDRYLVGQVDALPLEPRHHLISLTHVIEHLVDPGRMLQMLAARLQQGGHIYISAPYRPSLWRPRDGIGQWLEYSYLHVPAHVSYLSKRWFEQAAVQSGLRLVSWDPSHEGYQVFEAVLQKV